MKKTTTTNADNNISDLRAINLCVDNSNDLYFLDHSFEIIICFLFSPLCCSICQQSMLDFWSWFRTSTISVCWLSSSSCGHNVTWFPVLVLGPSQKPRLLRIVVIKYIQTSIGPSVKLVDGSWWHMGIECLWMSYNFIA